MGIVDDDIARVREATDLAGLVGEQVALKKVGRQLQGLCPFHSEKSASFSVNPELGVYYCFGCQASGDAITFVRETEHLDFVEAVELLARRAGIELRYDEKGSAGRAGRERKSRLVEAMEAAVAFYHRRLLDAPDAGEARKYLRSRGFDGDAVRSFAIGWAPDGWDDLCRELHRRQFTRDEIVEAGLGFVNRRDRLQDQFRGRVMFPIHDASGDPVAFGGRALGDQGPKYKNSPETPVYRKSRVLYGLDRAKADIVATKQAVVCEGYTDVMAFHLAGAPVAVATCGTALGEDHVRLLKRFTSRVVLAFDADAAGQAAAERFYQWEREHELEVAVAALDPGRDPADVWRDDPSLLVKALEEARPFLQFRVDRTLERADLSTPEGRARAAHAVAPLIAEHPDSLVRDQYVVQVADRLDLDPDRVRQAVAEAPKPGSPTASGAPSGRRNRPPVEEEPPPDDEDAPPPVPAEEISRIELELLRVAVHLPERLPVWIEARHLVSSDVRRVFAALEVAVAFADALEALDGSARRLLERVAVDAPPVADEDAAEYAADVAVRVVESAAERRQRRLLREGDVEASRGKQLLDDLAQARVEDDRRACLRLAEQLVTWIGNPDQ